jgi:hypothetical protein
VLHRGNGRDGKKLRKDFINEIREVGNPVDLGDLVLPQFARQEFPRVLKLSPANGLTELHIYTSERMVPEKMKTHSAKMIFGLGLAGLLSGALALLCAPLLGPTAPGPTFGLAIAVFLWLFARERSIVKALVFCVASSASYIGALFATIYADGAIPHVASNSFDASRYIPPAYIMAVGGTIGGFCVCAVALFLYSKERRQLLTRALGCSLAAGVLGVAAYAFGLLFEGPASTIPGSGFSSAMVTLFLVWPAGMGAVLGFALHLEPVPQDEGYWPGNYALETQPAVSRPTRHSQPFYVSFIGWALVGLLCAFSIFFWGGRLWTSRNFARQGRIYAEYRSTRPSLNDLPPFQAMDPEHVFIVQPIAGTTPSPIGRSLSKARAEQPEFADFRMCYMSLSTERCGGNPPAIDLEIVQYPTAVWADYAMRGKAFGSGPGYFQKATSLVRIGHHILALENPHERGHGEFYWADGSILVTVRSYTSDPTPFIDAYLQKFPSPN